MVSDDENPYKPPRDDQSSDPSSDADLDPIGASGQEPWDIPFRYWSMPKLFHSLELDGPFQECLQCGSNLLDESTPHPYLIERIFRGSEPIIEYALCHTCQATLSSELSSSSQQAIAEIFNSVDVVARMKRLGRHFGDESVDPWLSECFLTGKPRTECRGYQIVGRFHALQIEVSVFPLMLSDDAVEMIYKSLSKQTRDRFDDFMEHFSMPPEFGVDMPAIF